MKKILGVISAVSFIWAFGLIGGIDLGADYSNFKWVILLMGIAMITAYFGLKEKEE